MVLMKRLPMLEARLTTSVKKQVAYFLKFLLPSLGLIALGGYFYADGEIRLKLQQARVAEREAISMATNSIRTTLNGFGGDIEFLSKISWLWLVIEEPTPTNLDTFASILAAFLEAQGAYAQARWIDESGMERLRINLKDNEVHRAPQAALQNKSQRPYFIETSKLPTDSLYMSRLDLNVENGQLETPYEPAIRLAMPLIDEQGQRHGIVVLNYRGEELLANLARATGSYAKNLMLLNREGYWLYSRIVDDRWGFMLNKPTRLGARDSEAWRAITTSEQGGMMAASGSLEWGTVHPLALVQSGRSGAGVKPMIVNGDSDYRWHVALLQPNSELQALRDVVWQNVSVVMGFLALVAIVMSVWVTRAHVKIDELFAELAERARAAESATLEKSNFIANLSREIRTPMNAILGLAYVLEKMELPGDANELMRKIRMAGRSLLAIINDILDFSKIESGKLTIEHSPFRLDDVIDNLATIMSASAGVKELELIIDTPPKNLGRLRGDALRLGQVLINLTSNAIKFTERGYVEVLISEVQATEDRIQLHFFVRDTGIGIASDVQQEIFAPFSQADGSTSRRFGGTGLGLTISHMLIAAMGGELNVKSEIGKGSEFEFMLWFDREADWHSAIAKMANLDVVIADDNEIALEALQNIVQKLGWTATAFKSGEAVVQHVVAQHGKTAPRQVFLLDWNMPGGMDGLAAAKAIREEIKSDVNPLIVMVTSFDRDELLAEEDSAVADVILTKPITPSCLYNAVATALQRHHGEEAPLPDNGVQRLAGLRIQIVDDSEINREVAKRILCDEGAHVVLAKDGQQAVAWLEDNPDAVDIVLMDLQMPNMDGYEVTLAIRRIPTLTELPVIAFTAGNFMELRVLADEAGMNDFIAKPFDVDTAVALIIKLTGIGMNGEFNG